MASPWMVLFTPTKSFAAVRERPRAWLFVVVACLFAAAPGLAFFSVTDPVAFMLRELKASGKLDEMPPEALELVKTTVAPAMRVLVPVGAAAARLAAVLVVAALGFAFLRGTKKELRFAPCLAAVALATSPLFVHDALSTVIYLTRELSNVDARNPVLSNPAAWLSLHVENDVGGALLAGLDLFRLWAVWLAALGLNVVAGTKSAMPYVVTFGGHALLVGARVIGAATSSAFSG